MTYLKHNNTANSLFNSWLYYIALTFTVLYLIRYATSWTAYKDLDFLFRYFAFFFTTGLLLFSFLSYNIQGKLLFFFIILLSLVVGHNSNGIELLYFSSVLIFGAQGLSFKSIVKVHFLISLLFCLMNIFGNYVGIIPDALFVGEKTDLFLEGMNRKSYGYDWCTDFASHVFYITLSYWIIKNGEFNKKEIFLITCISVFILFETGTRMTFLMLLVLVVLSLYYRCRGKYGVPKYLWFFLVMSTPLFFSLSLFLTIQYDETNIYWNLADMVCSGRLHLGQDAIIEEGIPWLGQIYKMYGSGNSLPGEYYNYIDNTYIQYLVIYGIVISFLMLISNFFICYRAYKRKDCLIALAVSLSSLFGIITQFHYNIGFCPLLLATFANIYSNKYNDEQYA